MDQLEESLLDDQKNQKKSENHKKDFQPKKRKGQVQTWAKFLKELEEEKKNQENP